MSMETETLFDAPANGTDTTSTAEVPVVQLSTFDDRYYELHHPERGTLYLPSVSSVLHTVPVGRYNGLHQYQMERAVVVGIEAARRDLSALAERGSLVHALIERYNKGYRIDRCENGAPYDDDVWCAFVRYTQWFVSVNARVVASEMVVYWLPEAFTDTVILRKSTDGFAGTLDAVLEIDDPREKRPKDAGEDWAPKRCLIVLDAKTSRAVYDEHRIQVSAYREAVAQQAPDMWSKWGGGSILAGVLALNSVAKCGYTLSIVEDPDRLARSFLLRLACYYDAYPEFTPEVQILPAVVTPPNYVEHEYERAS